MALLIKRSNYPSLFGICRKKARYNFISKRIAKVRIKCTHYSKHINYFAIKLHGSNDFLVYVLNLLKAIKPPTSFSPCNGMEYIIFYNTVWKNK